MAAEKSVAEEIVEIYQILNLECTGVSPMANVGLNRLGKLAADAERRMVQRETRNREIMQENLGSYDQH